MILPWIYFHISTHRDYTCQTGVDDGFIIKASADTGVADWIVHYPQSNQDAEMVAVDFDTSTNVFGAGYSCTKADDADFKICDGIVAMFASSDGALMWEKRFTDLSALFTIKYDNEQGGGLTSREPRRTVDLRMDIKRITHFVTMTTALSSCVYHLLMAKCNGHVL